MFGSSPQLSCNDPNGSKGSGVFVGGWFLFKCGGGGTPFLVFSFFFSAPGSRAWFVLLGKFGSLFLFFSFFFLVWGVCPFTTPPLVGYFSVIPFSGGAQKGFVLPENQKGFFFPSKNTPPFRFFFPPLNPKGALTKGCSLKGKIFSSFGTCGSFPFLPKHLTTGQLFHKWWGGTCLGAGFGVFFSTFL